MKALHRLWRTLDDRMGISDVVGPIARHLVPPGTNWWYVFGSATLCAFVIQVVTGIALATVYIPATASAYQSLDFITHQAAFGRLLRGMHYFGASAMVLFAGIHMIRVFLMGSYKFPREMNWLTGLLLLALTIFMGFTGQLLRWNQDAVWAVVVGAEQAARVPFVGPLFAHGLLGGDTVGGSTLSRFYAFHVFFIPAIIFAAIQGTHLFQGHSARNLGAPQDGTPSRSGDVPGVVPRHAQPGGSTVLARRDLAGCRLQHWPGDLHRVARVDRGPPGARQTARPNQRAGVSPA